MKEQEILLSLIHSESEEDVISILKRAKYWDQPKNWQYFGGNENNYSIIGNQQSRPESAIVEKLINSVDAVLTRECILRGIDPEGSDAPQSVKQALIRFFGIYNGDLTELDSTTRSKLADNIGFVATGEKLNPNYIIFDTGEGQTPLSMPNTLLSLNRSNKLKIPFVQGKFNMGGTGVFRFCGTNNLQVILSKRNPEIASHENDPSKNEWGFTVIRRENPVNGAKSSHYSYLAPGGKVLSFVANGLPILPAKYPEAYKGIFKSGTFIKLFEYQIGTGLKSNIQFDFYNKLSALLPQVALPIKLYERRLNYNAHTHESVISGLLTRLQEDRGNNIEDGFPSSGFLMVNDQKLPYSIYVFKKDAYRKYTNNEGVLFTINGQTHGHLPKTFFNTKSVGLNYLSDSLLVMLDCSHINGRLREDLFMNSRDRLSNCPLKTDIEQELSDLLSGHQGLRELKERRREEEIDRRLSDNQPLTEILQKIIYSSPTLSSILGIGNRINTPHTNNRLGNIKPIYVGKRFPSYFTLAKPFDEDKPKLVPMSSKFRIEFHTDVDNDYFNREYDPGMFEIEVKTKDGLWDKIGEEEKVAGNINMNLWNGTGYLNMVLNEDEIGSIINIRCSVSDVSRPTPFVEEFVVRLEAPKAKPLSYNKKNANENKQPNSLNNKHSLPNIIEITRDGVDGKHSWNEQRFDAYSALKIKGNDDDGYDYFINVDNMYLKQEINHSKVRDVKIKQTKYKFGMVLLGMALLHDSKHNKIEEIDEESSNVFELIERVSVAVSPMIIPMIDGLNDVSSLQDLQVAVMA